MTAYQHSMEGEHLGQRGRAFLVFWHTKDYRAGPGTSGDTGWYWTLKDSHEGPTGPFATSMSAYESGLEATISAHITPKEDF